MKHNFRKAFFVQKWFPSCCIWLFHTRNISESSHPSFTCCFPHVLHGKRIKYMPCIWDVSAGLHEKWGAHHPAPCPPAPAQAQPRALRWFLSDILPPGSSGPGTQAQTQPSQDSAPGDACPGSLGCVSFYFLYIYFTSWMKSNLRLLILMHGDNSEDEFMKHWASRCAVCSYI